MARAHQRQGGVDRAVVDLFEAVVLEPQTGEAFRGHVVDLKNSSAVIQLDDHPIVVSIDLPGDGLTLAQSVELRLRTVDIDERSVRFELA
jgi:exoribonuclease R